MEVTCSRCHQTLEAESCYCSTCGLPQLVYATDVPQGQTQLERFDQGPRDAATIDWKPALRAAVLVAVPAGLLSSAASPLDHLELLWTTAAAGWAVVLYVRSQRPAWITFGAGARIGLVTGLMAAWLAFGISGGALFVERFLLHHSSQMDAAWKSAVEMGQQLTQQWTTQMGIADAAQMQAQKAQMLSPEGHAGWQVFGIASNSLFLILFGVGGGAMGARILARSRRPEI
jgi:hypothetical protein